MWIASTPMLHQALEAILKAAAPRALRSAEIRKALQDNGVAISFVSIGYALGQLEARNTAEQVGDSTTWRYQEGQPRSALYARR